MDLNSLTAEINRRYPTRDWNQQCQRLVWNAIQILTGTPDSGMHTYPTATAARHASPLVSSDAAAAPSGAIHYWRNPAEGHVGISLGEGFVLMTGTPYALGAGGQQLGNNYGVTTVWAYNSRMSNPYLGWSYRNGSNPSIIGLIEGEEDMSFTDKDRELLTSVKRAIFDINIQDFEKRPSGIGREILRLRDSQFLDKETSFGTPGGTLRNDQVMIELLQEILATLKEDK